MGHLQSQGLVEKFNDFIINKLRSIKLEDKENFSIHNAIDKIVNKYNNIPHSVTKLEPIKAKKRI